MVYSPKPFAVPTTARSTVQRRKRSLMPGADTCPRSLAQVIQFDPLAKHPTEDDMA